MMRFKEFLVEMAAARAHHSEKTYYHGTLKEADAKEIYKNGLDPAATEVKYGKRKSALRPEEGKVYITHDLSYAMIYGLGGDFFGRSEPHERDIKEYGEYGFVFEIDGKNLVDIGPDEDSVGELIAKFLNKQIERNDPHYITISNVTNLALAKCTDGQLKKLRGHEYTAYAQVGKKLNKIMSDKMKLDLIDAGTHIAHKGKLKVSKCWRFSRHDTKKINRDGSNFFEYAEEWKP